MFRNMGIIYVDWPQGNKVSLSLSAMFETIFQCCHYKISRREFHSEKVVLSKYTSTIFNVNLGSHINFSTEGHWKVNAGSHCRLALLFTDRQMDRPLTANEKLLYRLGWNIIIAHVKRRKLSRILERILGGKYSLPNTRYWTHTYWMGELYGIKR